MSVTDYIRQGLVDLDPDTFKLRVAPGNAMSTATLAAIQNEIRNYELQQASRVRIANQMHDMALSPAPTIDEYDNIQVNPEEMRMLCAWFGQEYEPGTALRVDIPTSDLDLLGANSPNEVVQILLNHIRSGKALPERVRDSRLSQLTDACFKALEDWCGDSHLPELYLARASAATGSGTSKRRGASGLRVERIAAGLLGKGQRSTGSHPIA